MTAQQPSPRTGAPRTQFVVMALVAIATLAGSVWLYRAARDGGVWGTTNQGEFVSPPLSVVELNVRDDAGMVLLEGGTWWLWVVSEGACGDDCGHALHRLRQLHVLLNRDAERVRRALVTQDGERDVALAERYPRLAFLAADVARLRSGIYIVDPLGNLVLHYPLSDAGKPVLDDLKRLLKVSQIG
jgi:hypothetical protein